MRRRGKIALAVGLVAGAALGGAGCSQDVEVDAGADQRGADLFARRCSGCHTLKAAGTQGSAPNVRDKQRTNGPNFNQRKEGRDAVLFAIRNGGFSGAIMPQNIVVGEDAERVAEFVAKYSGRDAERPAGPQE